MWSDRLPVTTWSSCVSLQSDSPTKLADEAKEVCVCGGGGVHLIDL